MPGSLIQSPIDRIERLQAISRLSPDEWLDLLQITWREYRHFQLGMKDLPLHTLERIAGFFQLNPLSLAKEDPDFETLAVRFQRVAKELPEEFLIGGHGRRRTTITSLEFIEKRYGWRLRNDILNHFRVDESSLRDPFAPISIRFITEMCKYLDKRQFRSDEFYQMGRHSLEGNIRSMLGQILSSCESLDELADTYFNRLVQIFETNYSYHYAPIDYTTGMLTCRSNPQVKSELGVKALGSPHVCEVKSGLFAILPGYLGLTDAKVSHVQCEHRGDPACVWHYDMSGCRLLSSSDH